MNLPHQIIQRHLRDPIRRRRDRQTPHIAYTRQPGRQADKDRPVGLLQKRPGGLEEKQRADGVDFEVRADFAEGDIGCGGVVLRDAGVGDHDVDVGDSEICLEGFDGFEGRGVGVAVDGDGDDFTAGAGGEGG